VKITLANLGKVAFANDLETQIPKGLAGELCNWFNINELGVARLRCLHLVLSTEVQCANSMGLPLTSVDLDVRMIKVLLHVL